MILKKIGLKYIVLTSKCVEVVIGEMLNNRFHSRDIRVKNKVLRKCRRR
jgi:hypothetical protein